MCIRLVKLGRWKYIHTAEVLISDLSPSAVEIAIEKLKMYKQSGIDRLLADLIEAQGEIL
jgi:hypothetical protein